VLHRILRVAPHTACGTTHCVWHHTLRMAPHTKHDTTHCMWYHRLSTIPYAEHDTTHCTQHLTKCIVPQNVHKTMHYAHHHTLCMAPLLVPSVTVFGTTHFVLQHTVSSSKHCAHTADDITSNFVEQTTNNVIVQVSLYTVYTLNWLHFPTLGCHIVGLVSSHCSHSSHCVTTIIVMTLVATTNAVTIMSSAVAAFTANLQ